MRGVESASVNQCIRHSRRGCGQASSKNLLEPWRRTGALRKTESQRFNGRIGINCEAISENGPKRGTDRPSGSKGRFQRNSGVQRCPAIITFKIA